MIDWLVEVVCMVCVEVHIPQSMCAGLRTIIQDSVLSFHRVGSKVKLRSSGLTANTHWVTSLTPVRTLWVIRFITNRFADRFYCFINGEDLRRWMFIFCFSLPYLPLHCPSSKQTELCFSYHVRSPQTSPAWTLWEQSSGALVGLPRPGQSRYA